MRLRRKPSVPVFPVTYKPEDCLYAVTDRHGRVHTFAALHKAEWFAIDESKKAEAKR